MNFQEVAQNTHIHKNRIFSNIIGIFRLTSSTLYILWQVHADDILFFIFASCELLNQHFYFAREIRFLQYHRVNCPETD